MNDHTRYEPVYLPSPGSLPGIPGMHAAGAYLIDWHTRTLIPGTEPPASETTEAPREADTERVVAPRPTKPEPVLVEQSAPTTEQPTDQETSAPPEAEAMPPAEQDEMQTYALIHNGDQL